MVMGRTDWRFVDKSAAVQQDVVSSSSENTIEPESPPQGLCTHILFFPTNLPLPLLEKRENKKIKELCWCFIDRIFSCCSRNGDCSNFDRKTWEWVMSYSLGLLKSHNIHRDHQADICIRGETMGDLTSVCLYAVMIYCHPAGCCAFIREVDYVLTKFLTFLSLIILKMLSFCCINQG